MCFCMCVCVRVRGYSSYTVGIVQTRLFDEAAAQKLVYTFAQDAYTLRNTYQNLYEMFFLLNIRVMIHFDIGIALAGFYNFAANT